MHIGSNSEKNKYKRCIKCLNSILNKLLILSYFFLIKKKRINKNQHDLSVKLNQF
jgi:hypothetical protein